MVAQATHRVAGARQRASMRLLAMLALLAVALLGAPAVAGPSRFFIPPVDGPIAQRFEAPATAYGSGHRGLDYGVDPGTLVRAASAGVVTFAGRVAGRNAVTIDHGQGLETTYTILAEIRVAAGELVGQGRYLGTTAEAHPGAATGLHFGVKLRDQYVDPLDYLGPVEVAGAIHLVPLAGDAGGIASGTRARGSGSSSSACRPAGPLRFRAPAPNDNVVVAVAGVNSSTVGSVPDLYSLAFGPERLGYAADRVYEFSYRGPDGTRLHRPYGTRDTWGNLRRAAARLRALLVRIARRHPGARVDLLAHSQGGVVARVLLEGLAESWDPALPRIEHVVTFATPHLGAALGELRADLDNTATGRVIVNGLEAWAERGGPLPHPRSVAVRQLTPGSPLMTWLATEDLTYGTRVLSLASAGDAIVPAPRSVLAGARNRVLAPSGWNAHAALVRSDVARAHAYAFLRDSAPSCSGAWDLAGSLSGRAIDFTERHAGDAVRALEPPGTVPVSRGLGWVGTRAGDALGWIGTRSRDALGWLGDRSRDALGVVESTVRAGAQRIPRIGARMSDLWMRGWRSLRSIAPDGVPV
jgi:hypothetical protein